MTVEPTRGEGEPDRPHEVEVLVVDTDTEFLVDLLDRVDRDSDALDLHTSQDVEETIARLEDGDVDCLVCTYDGGQPEGLELLDYVREHHVEAPVVLLPARETTIIDSRNLTADVDAVFQREEAVDRDVLGPHLVNVVEQQRAAASAERRSQVTEVMGKVARDVAGVEDPEAVEEAAIDRLDDVPAFDEGWMATVEDDGLERTAATADDPASIPGVGPEGPEPPLVSAAERAVDRGEPQVVTGDDQPYAMVPVVPDRGDERALAVTSDSKFAFEEPEVDLLSELGGTLRRTFETIATREALESRVDDLELVDELVEGMGVGVVVYGEDGRVERANEAFASLIGAEPEALSGTPVWELLGPREATSFDEHWAEVPREDSTVETATVAGEEFDLVTTRIEAEGVPYNVAIVVDTDEEGPMDPEFARTLSYEFRHWFDIAQEAVVEAREQEDPTKLQLVDQIVDRMHDAMETEVATATQPEVEPGVEPQLLGEVAGVAWNHVLGEAGSQEVKGGLEVLAHRGLLLRLFEHLFRTLLQYAESATSVDVGVTTGGFYVEDDGAAVPHARRAYATDEVSASDAQHGAGILVAERAAERMDWSLSMTDTEDGGTRFEITGVTFVRREQES
jgi:PAS domain S-box-containing protein